VSSAKANGNAFTISWTTNLPSTSSVTFTGIGTYSNTSLVTGHAMSFNGSRNATYTYSVSSTDANGNVATAGPFTHQN
jgi:hypothetical protein